MQGRGGFRDGVLTKGADVISGIFFSSLAVGTQLLESAPSSAPPRLLPIQQSRRQPVQGWFLLMAVPVTVIACQVQVCASFQPTDAAGPGLAPGRPGESRSPERKGAHNAVIREVVDSTLCELESS